MPDQLKEEMTSYLNSLPNVQLVISAAIEGPVYVSLREQKVWYYPAE